MTYFEFMGPQSDLPSPRFILVHSDMATLDANAVNRKAHAFGPFDDFEALLRFDKTTPKDTCYRFAIPLLGPEEQDLALMVRGVTSGFRPGAMPMPPRESASEPTPEHPLTQLIKSLVEHRSRLSVEAEAKAIKKATKKAEKAAKREHQRAIDSANSTDDGR